MPWGGWRNPGVRPYAAAPGLHPSPLKPRDRVVHIRVLFTFFFFKCVFLQAQSRSEFGFGTAHVRALMTTLRR